MSILFDKAIIFTDIHFGKKNNNREYNSECEKFVEWVISVAKKEDIDVLIFLGDWMDTRRSVNVSTLNYSLSSLEKLNKAFSEVFLILGNHDLYYREKREINSIEYVRNLRNIRLIKEITRIDNCLFVPWLNKSEYELVKGVEDQFVFGHFELPNFIVNSRTTMPDNGLINAVDFKYSGVVLSGHFHKRQNQGNIYYIGAAFPQDFSDTWDEEKGVTIIDKNMNLRFIQWPEQPRYIKTKLSDLLDCEDLSTIFKPKTYAKIVMDIEVSYEEVQLLRENLKETYGCREVIFIPQENLPEDFKSQVEIENLKTIDEIVVEGLKNLEKYDANLLIEIYNSLEVGK